MSSRYRTGYLWALVAALLYMLVLPVSAHLSRLFQAVPTVALSLTLCA
jgi:hypothetical protein